MKYTTSIQQKVFIAVKIDIPHHSNTKCQKMEQFDSLKEVCITVLLTSRNEISIQVFSYLQIITNVE